MKAPERKRPGAVRWSPIRHEMLRKVGTVRVEYQPGGSAGPGQWCVQGRPVGEDAAHTLDYLVKQGLIKSRTRERYARYEPTRPTGTETLGLWDTTHRDMR